MLKKTQLQNTQKTGVVWKRWREQHVAQIAQTAQTAPVSHIRNTDGIKPISKEQQTDETPLTAIQRLEQLIQAGKAQLAQVKEESAKRPAIVPPEIVTPAIQLTPEEIASIPTQDITPTRPTPKGIITNEHINQSQKIRLASLPINIEDSETMRMPATRVQPPSWLTGPIQPLNVSSHDRFMLPRFIESRGAEDPLVMLYRACLLCVETHGQPPDMLFVPRLIIPDLRRQTLKKLDLDYDGTYRFYSGSRKNNLEIITIKTEAHIPQLLRLALGLVADDDRLQRDIIIAIVNEADQAGDMEA